MPTKKTSAGLLMFRLRNSVVEIFLAHPGGPHFRRKDEGHWTIPKGEIEPGEEKVAAAIREFKEETGIEAKGDLIPLGSVKQRGGKTVFGWAFAGNWDDGCPIVSNCHQLEWPPKSGRFQEFPEIDQAQFFSIEQARAKLKETQWPFVERLLAALGQCAKIAPGD